MPTDLRPKDLVLPEDWRAQPHLAVNEIFKTLQGEGPSSGRPAIFLRLYGCNLKCTWCDTPYTWDPTRHKIEDERHFMTNKQVFATLNQALTAGYRLVITGGEPLLQLESLYSLCSELKTYDIRLWIEVETAGTRFPKELVNVVDQFNVSPKLKHSGNTEQTIFPEILKVFKESGKSIFKFVVSWTGDLQEVAAIVKIVGIPNEQVWIMPEGTVSWSHLGALRMFAEECITRGWSLSPRMHILLFGGAARNV